MNSDNYPRCPHCGIDWHGLTIGACPGSHVARKDLSAWQREACDACTKGGAAHGKQWLRGYEASAAVMSHRPDRTGG